MGRVVSRSRVEVVIDNTDIWLEKPGRAAVRCRVPESP
jgi:hypothetical protein